MSLEQTICQWLRPVLADLQDGTDIPDSEAFREVLGALAFFVPSILAEIHPEWRWYGLDGIFPINASRLSCNELELLGICCFVADPTLTPIHVRLRLASHEPAIEWFECRVGKLRNETLVRAPYTTLRQMTRRIQRLRTPVDEIDWAWHVQFGQ